MEIYTDNWFKYVRENVLAEGLRDIGLPEFVIDYLEDAMPDASEKARMYIANGWKQSRGSIAGFHTTESFRYEVLSFLIKQLDQYVIKQHQSAGDDIEARTLPSYDMNEPEKEREMYDDERIKQNEQVKFVIQNIRNVVGKPMGQWRKAFMKAVKALSKAGLPSEKVESIKEYLRSTYAKSFHNWLNQYTELISFLNDDATNYELIKDEYSIQDAQDYAEKFLRGQESPENIMHQFDDGSYWYNLNVTSCDMEAARMGHCGSDSRGVLVSLRKPIDKKSDDRSARERRIEGMSESFVTMAYSQYESTLYQIKGRSNDAPPEETWDHIAWFINNMDVQNVEETGEHSSDVDTIREMIEYLASQTNASFHGSIEDRLEKAEEYCANVEQRYNDNQDELGYGSVGYTLEEMDVIEVYCYANANYEFEIDLGWTGIEETEGGYKSENADFEEIPRTYSNMREFIDEIDVDTMMYDMPGDDGDYEYEVVMLVGAQRGDVSSDDAVPTAHLRIRMYTNQTLSVDEDGDVPEFDEFVDNMLAFEEDDAPNYKEQVRQALAEGGYMSKTAYDRSKEELMKLTNLDKWHVKQQGSMLEFDWTADDGQPLHTYSGQPALDDVRAQMYGTGTGNRMGINPDAVMREMFGFGQRYSLANKQGINDPIIANAFARELSRAITTQIKSRRASPGQQSFDFGDQYKDVDPTMILADDTDFVVFSDVKYHGGPFSSNTSRRYPSIGIKWLYRMRVSPESEPDETEIIQDIAAYLNEHEELVTQAADKVIGMYVDGMMENIQKRKDKVMSNQEIQGLINRGMDVYGKIEVDGPTGEVAQRIVTILQWFESNYSDMGEAERYVMATKFLIPIAQNNFRSYSDMGQIDNNTGAPVMFGELATAQREMMGGQPAKMVTRNQGQSVAGTVGEPRPAQESMEAQIDRIEKLINSQASLVEDVDIRLYKMQVDAKISSDRLRKTKQLQDQLRGITNVTTVTSEASKETIGGEFVRFGVKFTLKGQASSLTFAQEQLIPTMNSIDGVTVINRPGIGWSAPVEVTPGKKLSEVQSLQEYGFGGGVASNLGAQRYSYGKEMPTPRPMLQTLIDDWVEGGVMAYDAPTDTTDMRYHTMMPVEELLPFMSSEYRGDMNDFTGRYQQFIRNGATAPVYLAIGMNGRCKISGNEDIVWFAKKSGLAEVPVFLSYQKQV